MARRYEQYLSMYEIDRNYGVKMYNIQTTIYNSLKDGFDLDEIVTALSNSGYVAGLLISGPLMTAANTLLGAVSFVKSMAPSDRDILLMSCREGYLQLSYNLGQVLGNPKVDAVKADMNLLVIENDNGSTIKFVTALVVKAVSQNGNWITY